MPSDGDDAAAPQRSAVRPPPSDASVDVEVPRMDPPPPSLEAMVERNRRKAAGKSSPSKLWWLALAVVAAGLTAYLAR